MNYLCSVTGEDREWEEKRGWGERGGRWGRGV